MRLLSFAVAALAVIALVVGQQSGSHGILGLGAVGLLLAFATFRATEISTFLKVFSVIFAVEYVATGAGAVLAQVGFWPSDWQAIAPPASLPTTIAVFGILVYGISFIPAIRRIARLASPYFEAPEATTAQLWPAKPFSIGTGRLGIALLVFLVVLNQIQVGISLRLSFFNRDFYNAIQEKDAATFWYQLIYVFSVWAAIFVISNLIEMVANYTLLIRWRRWMAESFSAAWLRNANHYRVSLAHTADNPDQRIAEDTRAFVNQTYSFALPLLTQVSTLVSFSIILWSIPVASVVPGTEISIPGFIFWMALIYSVAATWIAHLIGRPMIGLEFEQEKREANFRYSLARLREYSEQIALMRGETSEQRHLTERFGDIVQNFYRLVWARVRLTTFTLSFAQANVVVPYILLAPHYFSGKITLGIMTQVASAFDRVQTAMSFFIDRYQSIASYVASINRLTTFEAAIAQAEAQGAGGTDAGIDIAQKTGKDTTIETLSLTLPNGKQIVNASDLTLPAGHATLVVGPSGSGKSTLFRALAGIWPFGKGKVATPAGQNMLLLPQRPYLPQGSLRAVLSYPAEPNAFSDADIQAAMEKVKLGHLTDRLDEVDLWGQRLSGGEQQRLAVARALLAKPDWLFLDEATASLDETLENEIYAMIRRELPQTSIVSIGHRSTLRALHDGLVAMEKNADGTFSPKAKVMAEAK
ncbi:putative ATP-binding cassette transporter [Bosea sp. 62]|uniref:ABC transporter ATP-binding protein/permease n=1 Tax=unclassified Bosea (in: a-proteobacteria) TaxID=2653178 RepID=UPI00125C9E6E|nr:MULTISPECIES: ABC transporter ATP-binding protein/permease [unclassified Bosea (in: a-proteobacteria)]CAD5291190.1 putative ATP-binding cassette transporter [Bosea sp. 7B]CAD5299793.1 putative ATP-binding cassette transporter [Bosea sp. 21B]CAD5300450.1 putative ATP-binding cassette transporter [Bosea sp. 46]VVT61766.1 putative ATP-binding cassette transporter [Bosea sp. EC-HK365B]VXB03235.1 putative ATP-binding cassette transporter [Bosea sp. 127]